MPLTMGDLINTFLLAKKSGAMFVAVNIRMEGFEQDEIIINPRENFDSKLDYYMKTYNDDLTHVHAKGIAIVGYTYANRFDSIQADLVD